jgi:hypothetical protein
MNSEQKLNEYKNNNEMMDGLMDGSMDGWMEVN